MSARVETPQGLVCRKRRYRSKTNAKRAAKRNQHQLGKRLRAYTCPHCGWVHLTSLGAG